MKYPEVKLNDKMCGMRYVCENILNCSIKINFHVVPEFLNIIKIDPKY